MTDIFNLFWNDSTFRIIALGTALLCATGGMIGTFAVLRQESLLGDAVSHAALPGIAVAFLVSGTKSGTGLLVGALLSGLLAAFCIRKIVQLTHLKSDTALGLVLSVFFGFGIMLLTFIQKLPDAAQAGLDRYLFGQAATLSLTDVKWFIGIFITALGVLLIFWKELKIVLFDREYATTIGFHVKFIDSLITFFVVLVIVLGLQTVGVILMSAILLAPAAAARQWTNRLSFLLVLSALFGAVSGILGTTISASADNLSTGPVIVLISGVFVFISFLFAPSRGFLSKSLKYQKNQNDLRTLKILHSVQNNPEKSKSNLNTKRVISNLKKKGWLAINNSDITLTREGSNHLQKLKQSYDPSSN